MTGLIRKARVLSLLLSVLLAACASYLPLHAPLFYPPSSHSSTTHTAKHVAPSNFDVRAILNPFTDKRSDTSTVGGLLMPWGVRMPVTPTRSVPDWVLQALRTELENSGYTVVTGIATEDVSAGRNVVVSGEILNVFCDSFIKYKGRVSLVVRANQAGNEILNRRYDGEGSSGIVWVPLDDEYAQSLALALASALHQFISDLDKSVSTE